MLSLDQCLKANRPLVFVVAESDIEVLQHVHANYKKHKYFVYSSTLSSTPSITSLLEDKFRCKVEDRREQTIDTLSRILSQEFDQRNNKFQTYFFLDCAPYITDKQNIRRIKDIVTRYTVDADYAVNLVFVSNTVCVPPELERLSEVVFFDLPAEDDLKDVAMGVAKKLNLQKKGKMPSKEAISNLRGLTKFEAEQAILQSYANYQEVRVDFIRDYKKSALSKTNLLSLLESDVTFDDIGGMSTLKAWVRKSAGAWTIKGQEFGLPILKGLLLVGLPGCGKAQPLDSPVFTPFGPRRMGSIKEGDTVLTPSGKTASVKRVFPQGCIDVYRVHFEDGASTECSSDHLWKVSIRDRRHVADKWVVPTSFLLDKVVGRYDKKNNLYVEVPVRTRYPMRSLPLGPYTMGALLGDGSFVGTPNITSMDPFIVEKVRKDVRRKNCRLEHLKNGRHGRAKAYSIVRSWKKRVNRVRDVLERVGLMSLGSHEKFIPEQYLYSSHKQRVELLRGLMDTDGSIYGNGTMEFTTTSNRLSCDFKLLVESLGGLCFTRKRPGSYVKNGVRIKCKESYRSFIRININPFSLPRKRKKVKKRTKYANIQRVISKIEYVGKKDCQCIALDDLQNLYMTDNYIVTHNSLIAKALGNEWKLPVVQFDPSRIFSSRVGDSEANVRRVLQIVENISPCVLFLDEAEKGFAGMHSSTFSDAGVTARVIGSFLVWMQECTKPVFTVATSNNIQYLPPELISRFDENFFVNMPTFPERVEIYKIHLKKLGRDPSKFHVENLAMNSQDLSGREIEQVLKEAMYDAFHADLDDISTEIIMAVLKRKTSILRTMAEQLKYVLDWVGWDEEKEDGIRARYANPTEKKEVDRVNSEIENLLKDIEKGGGSDDPLKA